MAYYDDRTHISADEAARRMGMTRDELLVFTLESARPNYITEGGETRYETADVELLAREMRS